MHKGWSGLLCIIIWGPQGLHGSGLRVLRVEKGFY